MQILWRFSEICRFWHGPYLPVVHVAEGEQMHIHGGHFIMDGMKSWKTRSQTGRGNERAPRYRIQLVMSNLTGHSFLNLHRAYFMPKHLHKIFPNQSGDCPRCSGTPAHFLHIIWGYPRLGEYWTAAAQNQRVTGPRVENCPTLQSRPPADSR